MQQLASSTRSTRSYLFMQEFTERLTMPETRNQQRIREILGENEPEQDNSLQGKALARATHGQVPKTLKSFRSGTEPSTGSCFRTRGGTVMIDT